MTIPEQAAQAMRDAGLLLEGLPIMDGEIHRCQDSTGSSCVSYIGHLDAHPLVWWRNHKTGETQTWHAKDGTSVSKADALAIRKSQEERKQEREKRYEEVSEKAWDMFWDYSLAYSFHPYLLKKHITHMWEYVRQDGDRLIVPLFGPLYATYQTIGPDGTKRMAKGGCAKGAYHIFWKYRPDPTPIFLSEGFATAASILLATGCSAMCVTASNMPNVAKQIKEEWPERPLIICGDDDRWSRGPAGNVGRRYAEQAAWATGSKVVFPVFPSSLDEEKPTDFNDLHCLCGLEAVREQLNQGDPDPCLGINENEQE